MSRQQIEVSHLNLQRLVTKEEIQKMRELKRLGFSLREIARITGRSYAAVQYYLHHDPEEGRLRRSS